MNANDNPQPIPDPHFPNKMCAFLWRNWPVANPDRMAAVLETTPANVRAVGEALGLPPHREISPFERQRNYISVIRRNWHLIPDEQMLTLLDWSREEYEYTLKEDDFLWIKLGSIRPDCPPLRYAPLTEAEAQRAAEIKQLVQERFADPLRAEAEPRFQFVRDLSAPTGNTPAADGAQTPIRFLYSYFAVYGDPLLKPELDPYPDGLLERLAMSGVNGVWLHTVLRQLAPSSDFPEFGEGWETRLANLRQLVERARRYGIHVYLYMNEPRSMPREFFDQYPEAAGAPEQQNLAFCTADPRSLRFVREGLEHVFREVPGLGGVFSISASENLTHCWSRNTQDQCPRCRDRNPSDVIAEVNQAIEEGVHRSAPDAAVLVWDWGWQDPWVEGIIRRLPTHNTWLMSVSEWSLPLNRGGIEHPVQEYSMSAVGPGPRAQRHWAWAREAGLPIIAKVQVNCTWEISAVPYLPVMDLVGQHLNNLREAGVDGMMLSWTLGGCPSPNLELARILHENPDLDLTGALDRLAADTYGNTAAPKVREAWTRFSEAFAEYPYSTILLYAGPCQVAPANLLYPEPTGYGSTMVGFPYDDLANWTHVHPPEIFIQQFEKMAEDWNAGLAEWQAAVDAAREAREDEHAAALERDLVLAEAAGNHFRSVANQARYFRARDAGEADVMRAMLDAEIRIAERHMALCQQDSRIGYEASNHYYYFPLDFVEKVVHAEYVRGRL